MNGSHLLLCGALAALLAPLGRSHAQGRAESETEAGREAEVDVEGEDLAELDDLFTLDEVVVTGARREQRLADTVVDTEVIDAEQIRTSGSETVAELLEEQPGVDIFQDVRGQSVRLLGFDPEHVLILIDGERTVGRINGGLDLSRYSLDEIERVEIVRGASSALYGSDALGGVVNLITRDADEPWTLEGRATYGFTDPQRSNRRSRFQGGPRADDQSDLPQDSYSGTYDITATAGHRAERWGGRLTLGYHRLDAFDLDPRDDANTGPLSSQFSGSAQLHFEPSDRHRIRVRASYSYRDTEALEQRGRVVYERLTRTEDLQTFLKQTIELPGDHGELEIALNYSRFDDQYLVRLRDDPPPTAATDTTEQLGEANLRWNWLITPHHAFTAGVDTYYEALESDRLSEPGGRLRVAPYLQHEWSPLDSPYLAIVPGLRADFDTSFGSAVSPKLSVRIDPIDELAIRLSGGRGFRSPGFRELLLNFTDNESIGYVVEGNPELQPETSWTVNGSVEARPHDRVWLAALAHWSLIDDLITTDALETTESGATRYSYVNIARARTAGFELRARTEPVDGLQFGLSYTFLDAEDLDSGEALPGRARHRGSFRASYRHDASGVHALVRSQLVGPRFFSGSDADGTPTLVESEAYLSLDLRLEKRFGDHVRLFVGADNVMNNGGTYLGVRPRTFYTGIAVER